MISVIGLIIFGICLVILVAMSVYGHARKVKARRDHIAERAEWFLARHNGLRRQQ